MSAPNAKAAAAAEPRAHIAALDGLRAVAVAGVILFHINPLCLAGGFAGVDVFFVLSGFLITSILLSDIRGGAFSFKEFYLRRIQRLLPNAILTVAVTILLLTFFIPAGLEIFTARHGVWTLFNLSNIYTWAHHGGYWDTNAEWAYFTHFWSLGIEEQYYLFFPLFLFLLTRFARRRVPWFLLAAVCASFALCYWGSYNRAAATFYWLPTRVWELLLGSFLASAGFSLFTPNSEKKRLPRAHCELLGWGGIALILVSFFTASGKFVFPGWIVLLPTLGSAFVLVSILSGESTLARALSTKPFTAVGRVSYSLYLWHWPLIVFGRMRWELSEYSQTGFPWGWADTLARWLGFLTGVEWSAGALFGGIASLATGTGVYFLVERPLRSRGAGRGKRLAIIAFLFAGTLALCVWSAWFKPFKTFPQFDPVTVSADYYNFRAPDAKGAPPEPPKMGSPIAGGIFAYDVTTGEIQTKGVSRKVLENGGLLHLHGGGETCPSVVLWGSSHANMFAPMLDELCRGKKLSIAFFGKNAEPPFNLVSKVFPEDRKKSVRKFYEEKMRWIKEWNPATLFLCERWDRWYAWDAENLDSFAKQLDAFLVEMEPFRTKVVFVVQIPVSPHGEQMNPRAVADFLSTSGGTLPVFREPKYFVGARAAFLRVLESAAAKHKNLRILRGETPFLNSDGSLRYTNGRAFYYFDEDHLSDAGTRAAAPLFAPFLER